MAFPTDIEYLDQINYSADDLILGHPRCVGLQSLP